MALRAQVAELAGRVAKSRILKRKWPSRRHKTAKEQTQAVSTARPVLSPDEDGGNCETLDCHAFGMAQKFENAQPKSVH